MPEHRHALSGSEIEILVAGFVEQPAAFAAGDDHIATARGRAAENAFFSFACVSFLWPVPVGLSDCA